MTISTEMNLAVYQGNGATTVFAFPFYVLEEGDLEIQLQAAESGTVTHTYVSGEYTLSGVGDPAGGSVTILGTPITSDYKLTIERLLPYTQPLDLVNETGFYPDEVEKQFDRDVMQTQQLKRLIDAAITVPKGETGFTLPAASTRASKYLAFDAGGDLVTVVGTSSDPAVTANMLRVTSRAALKALNVTLYALAFLDHVSGGVFKLRQGVMPTDVQEGIYIASNTATYYWEREWDGIHGKPEWFGAIPDDTATNCATAIQACITLCPITLLAAKKYYIGQGSTTPGAVLLTLTSGKRMQGVAPTQFAASGFTELVIRSGTASGVLVGTLTSPGGTAPNTWVENAQVRDLTIRRDVASYQLANPASGTANAPTGLILRYAAICKIVNVWSIEHSFGFDIGATVACQFDDCRALRYTDGTSAGNDFFVGYYQDNSYSTPYNSGNASLYYNRCGAFSNESAGNTYTYNAGIQIYQGFTDTFITDFESANCGYGIDAHGRSSTAGDWHTEDLIITRAVLDGCRFVGINLETGGPNTAVKVTDCYVGSTVATSPSSIGIRVKEMHGTVNLSGNQLICVAGNPATGLLIDASSGVTSKNIITNFQDPIILTSAVCVCIEDDINAGFQGPATAGLQLTSCTVGRIAPNIRVSDAAFTFPLGVQMVSTGNRRIEVNCSGINSASITGGAANKLVSNGSQVTTNTTFNTDCLSTGVMA